MLKRVIVPILLLVAGLFNLFPETLKPMISIGYQAVTIQTLIGLVSVILAIGLLSALTTESNGEKK